MSSDGQNALSLVHGPQYPPLWNHTIGSLLNERVRQYGAKQAVVVPWQNVRLTYDDLNTTSELVARGLLALGLRPGDKVAILAGNRAEYIEIFLGAGRIGCPLVVLNNTYTPAELLSAISRMGRRALYVF